MNSLNKAAGAGRGVWGCSPFPAIAARLALICDGVRVTYADLDEASKRIRNSGGASCPNVGDRGWHVLRGYQTASQPIAALVSTSFERARSKLGHAHSILEDPIAAVSARLHRAGQYRCG